jgi:hypothetical protein
VNPPADLICRTVVCFVFGAAAEALSQIRPGALVALLHVRWDERGCERCLKLVDASSVREIGTSVDMAFCKGTTRAGAQCRSVVNRRLHGAFCDSHLSQERDRIAMGVRPECKGTLLMTAFDRGAKHMQRRVEGAAVGRSWQEKIAQTTPKKYARNSTSASTRPLSAEGVLARAYRMQGLANGLQGRSSQRFTKGPGLLQLGLLVPECYVGADKIACFQTWPSRLCSFVGPTDRVIRAARFGVLACYLVALIPNKQCCQTEVFNSASNHAESLHRQAAEHLATRAGSAGAKVITAYCEQQQERQHRKHLKQREAALYRNSSQAGVVRQGRGDAATEGNSVPGAGMSESGVSVATASDVLAPHQVSASAAHRTQRRGKEPVVLDATPAAAAAASFADDIMRELSSDTPSATTARTGVQMALRNSHRDKVPMGRPTMVQSVRHGKPPPSAGQRVHALVHGITGPALIRPSRTTEGADTVASVVRGEEVPVQEGSAPRAQNATRTEAVADAEDDAKGDHEGDEFCAGGVLSSSSLVCPVTGGKGSGPTAAKSVDRMGVHAGCGTSGARTGGREHASSAGFRQAVVRKPHTLPSMRAGLAGKAASCHGGGGATTMRNEADARADASAASVRNPTCQKVHAGSPEAGSRTVCSDSGFTTAGMPPAEAGGVVSLAAPLTARERAKAAMVAATAAKAGGVSGSASALARGNRSAASAVDKSREESTSVQGAGQVVLRDIHMVNPLQGHPVSFPYVSASEAPGARAKRTLQDENRAPLKEPSTQGPYEYRDAAWGARKDGSSFVEPVAKRMARPRCSGRVGGDGNAVAAAGSPLSAFERAFGVGDAPAASAEARIGRLAADTEWASFSKDVERLTELVRCVYFFSALFFHSSQHSGQVTPAWPQTASVMVWTTVQGRGATACLHKREHAAHSSVRDRVHACMPCGGIISGRAQCIEIAELNFGSSAGRIMHEVIMYMLPMCQLSWGLSGLVPVSGACTDLAAPRNMCMGEAPMSGL